MEEALSLEMDGSFVEAINCYHRAMDAGADPAEATLRIAGIFRKMNMSELAIALASSAAAMDPASIEAHEFIIVTAEAIGDRAATIAASQRAIKIAPDFVPAYNALGAALIQMGDISAALRITAALVRLEPGEPAHHIKLAMLYQHQGEIGLAVREFSEAIRLNPDTALADSAREALAGLDMFQFSHIVMLANEDRVFRLKLARAPESAVKERGFCLSHYGIELLVDFCTHALSALPEPLPTVLYH